MQTITIKLRVRDKHARALARKARAVNYVWNYCNETQRKAVGYGRKWLSGYDLGKLTAGTSKELGLRANTIDRVCQQYEHSRLQRNRPHLKWRSRKSLGWVPFKGVDISFDGATFKYYGHRYEVMHLREVITPHTKFRAGSFSADSCGRWYLNVAMDVDTATAAPVSYVGIDLGLKTLAVLSDGKKVETPSFFRKFEIRIGTSQRAKKSKHTRAIHAKVKNRRKDFLHKASASITQSFGFIAIGDVSPSRLTQTWLAKSVLDAGWADFKWMLSYKSIRNGGSTLEVSEYLTSQVCSECGALPPSRPGGIAGLSKRVWTCDDCGADHDRDVNAARNILRGGLATLIGGAASKDVGAVNRRMGFAQEVMNNNGFLCRGRSFCAGAGYCAKPAAWEARSPNTQKPRRIRPRL